MPTCGTLAGHNIMTHLKTILIALLLALALPFTASADKKKENPTALDVKLQSGEKWWGLVVDSPNLKLPFEPSFTINTATLGPTLYKANLLLSNRGRYVWSESPLTVSYDGKKLTIAASNPDDITPTLQKSGRTLREAYLMCCHKHFPPHDLSTAELLFSAPIYELGGEEALLYTQQDVIDFADTIIARGAPCGTILLPMGWNSPSGAPTFDLEAYPNPKEMVEILHSKGMNVMLTVSPYIMAAGRGFQQSRRDGTLICDATGQPTVFETRLGYTACRDITPAQADTLNLALKKLQQECDIDGFYFDCLDALQLLNNNPVKLESFLEAWHKAGNGIGAAIFSTPSDKQLTNAASTISTSRECTWETLGNGLTTAVNASVLGFSRVCVAADLNFNAPEGNNTDELVLRTAQLAATMPIAIIPYAVWEVENNAAIDAMLAWRAEMSPYYLELARKSATSAEPIIRHIEYQFPRTGFSNCDNQFMIGDRYMVIPVVDQGARQMVRLPKGKWQDSSGRIIKGPRVIDVDVSKGDIVVFKATK